MNNRQMLDAALDAAVKVIQDELGVTTGDFAGMFFTGVNRDIFDELMDEYIKDQVMSQAYEDFVESLRNPLPVNQS